MQLKLVQERCAGRDQESNVDSFGIWDTIGKCQIEGHRLVVMTRSID